MLNVIKKNFVLTNPRKTVGFKSNVLHTIALIYIESIIFRRENTANFMKTQSTNLFRTHQVKSFVNYFVDSSLSKEKKIT